MKLPEKIEAGEELEVQVAPFGKFPGYFADGKPAGDQVCDAAAFNRIVAAFKPEVLVDFEHQAEEGGPTTAAAWIQSLRVDKERGLVARFKFTDIGAEAVSNRQLRFLSPVWILGPDGRPMDLVSVALTNKPNLPVEPVLNRAAGAEPGTQKGSPMDKLKELLGLAPDAGDDQIIAAVSALKARADECENKCKNSEAEQFAEANKKCCNKEALKKAYLLNKEAAEALVAGFVPPPAPHAPVVNVAGAKAPAINRAGGSGLSAREELAALPTNKRADYYAAHRAEIDE